MAVGVLVEEAFLDIGMNFRRVVIHFECDYEEDWLKPLEEGWQTQSVDQWVELLTRPDTEDEVHNIDYRWPLKACKNMQHSGSLIFR